MERIRSYMIHEGVSTDYERKPDTEGYVLDGKKLLRHVLAGKGKLVITIYSALVPDLVSLIHGIYDHPGVASALVLLRGRFHWSMTSTAMRKYVLKYGCGRRKRSSSRRIGMPPDRVTRPWEVLEIDLMRVRIIVLANNEYLLLALDMASEFPIVFPLPTKQAEGVAR